MLVSAPLVCTLLMPPLHAVLVLLGSARARRSVSLFVCGVLSSAQLCCAAQRGEAIGWCRATCVVCVVRVCESNEFEARRGGGRDECVSLCARVCVVPAMFALYTRVISSHLVRAL